MGFFKLFALSDIVNKMKTLKYLKFTEGLFFRGGMIGMILSSVIRML